MYVNKRAPTPVITGIINANFVLIPPLQMHNLSYSSHEDNRVPKQWLSCIQTQAISIYNNAVIFSRDWWHVAVYMSVAKPGALTHYTDAIMGTIASQISSLTIVYSTVYTDADQRKHQSSASLAFVRGIHRRPVNSPHKWPVTRKMFTFDDVIMGIASQD